MRQMAVSVLVSLKDQLSQPLGGLQKRLGALGDFGKRLGLDKVGSALSNVGKEFTKLAAIGTAAFGATVGAAWGFARSIANAGDAAMKASQRVGIGVESFQELEYAADLSDLSVSSLERGLGSLNEKAMAGDEMFEKLGIQLHDAQGNIRDSGELLKDLAGVFAELPDGVEKSALAAKVFGDRLGRELIPFLNEGREGLEALGQEARDLGIILPEELAQAAVDWNDNITRLGAVFTGMKMELFGPLIPVFNDLTEAFRAFMQEHRAEIVAALDTAIRSVVGVIPDLISGFQTVGEVLGPALSAAGSLVDSLGGMETVVIALATVISGKLIAALVALGAALLTTPVGWFMLAVTGIALLAKTIYDNWDGIKEWFADLWQGVKAATQVAWDWIKEALSWHPYAMIYNNWGDISTFFSDLWGEIRDGFSEMMAGAQEWVSELGSAIASNPGAVLQAGIDLMQALWDGLKSKFQDVIAWVKNIPGMIRDIIGNPFAYLEDRYNRVMNFIGLGSGEEPAAAAALPTPEAIDALALQNNAGRLPEESYNLDPFGGNPQLEAAAAAKALARTQERNAGVAKAEADVSGTITVKVDGPGQVTAVENQNRKVRMQPDRGPSLVNH